MKKEEIRQNNLPTSDSHLGGGYLESKRNPGGNRKKILLIVVGILLTLGIVVGVSYAWWTHTVSQEGINTIQSTCLEIELADENPITLQNAYPITDTEASLLTPYTFTIKNKCNTLIEYDVNLDIMESSHRLSSSYIAIEFNGGEKKLLNTLESVETSYQKTDYTPVEGRYLVSGELGSNESKSYSLKLWMNESVTVENDAMNKNFISKIVVTAKQSHKVRLVDYVINDNEIEEFSHEATAQTKALTDYRYVGANPNNYVYFGCKDNCTEDNLYRIIGVMPTQSEVNGTYENRVKLIKANNWEGTTAVSGAIYTKTGKAYRWNTSPNNNWEESSLKNTLNTEYWNNLGEYQNYIEQAKWYLGAPTSSDNPNLTPKQLYNIERSEIKGHSNGAIYYIDNIGLMYPSDFGYSINGGLNGEVWNESIYNNRENYQTSAWLYQLENKYREWTITPETGYSEAIAWIINSDGYLFASNIYSTTTPTSSLGVRPTFYLKSNVLYQNGNGSLENPFKIGINE